LAEREKSLLEREKASAAKAEKRQHEIVSLWDKITRQNH
jgi:hypothetical protein